MAAMENDENDGQTAVASAAIVDGLLQDVLAEGLTPTSLQICLSKIDVRRDELARALLQRTIQLCSAAPSLSATDDAPASTQLRALAEEANCTSAVASLAPTDLPLPEDTATALVARARDHAALAARFCDALAAAADVARVVDVQRRVARYDDAVAQGAYSQAARLLTELQRTSTQHQGASSPAEEHARGSSDDHDALSALQVGVEERVRLFTHHLVAAPPQYIVIDPATRAPLLRAPAEQAAAVLSQVWDAAHAMGVADHAVETLARFVIEACVKPVLATEGVARGVAERALYKALKNVCEGALRGRADLIRGFGAVLWPELSDAYVMAKLRPMRPASDAQLETFIKGGNMGVKLEEKAVKLGLLPHHAETAQGPIGTYVGETIAEVLRARRGRWAAAARDALTAKGGARSENLTVRFPSSPSTETAGVSSASTTCPTTDTPTAPSPPQEQEQKHETLQADTTGRSLASTEAAAASTVGSLPGDRPNESRIIIDAAAAELEHDLALGDVGSYAITQRTAKVCGLMDDALKEAVASGNQAVAQAMCGAVIDMASLVVALEPEASTQQERELPYFAAIRYNDCMHVYRTLCTLPVRFAPALQTLVHPSVCFVSAARGVRAAGDDAMDVMMARQRAEVLEIARDISQGWGRTLVDASDTIRARKAAHGLRAAFQRLGTALGGGVLPSTAFADVTGELMNAACGVIANAILRMEDISEEQSKEIPAVLEPVVGGIDASSGDAKQRERERERGGGGQRGQGGREGYGGLGKGLIAAVVSRAVAKRGEKDGQRSSEATQASGGHTPGHSVTEDDEEITEARLRALLTERAVEWTRLREVCELLDVPSREIAARWKSGRLKAAGLTQEQVVHLVKALFEDTTHRQRSLDAIMAVA